MKQCNICKKIKNDLDFNRNVLAIDGLESSCRYCRNIYKKKWRLENKNRVSIYNKKYRLENKEYISTYNKKYRYKNISIARNKFFNDKKFTIDDYNKIFEKQKGCCAICGRHQSEFKRALNIDHNHITGEIRGLLCFNCNTGLGKFYDNEKLLLNAINYLNKHE